MTLGEKLQNLRTDAGMSQEDLADRLGVSRQAISKWELGKTVPDVKYIVELSNLYRISTDYLLKDDEPIFQQPLPSPKPAKPSSAPTAPRDRSSLIAALLLCGDIFLLMLILLHFPLLFIFAYRLTLLPLLLVLVLAPVFFCISLAFLRSPSQALQLYRHAAAGCLTLWGLAIAVLLGYNEVVDDLLFSMVEGWLSIPLFAGLTAVLLGGLYAVSLFLVRLFTRKI